MTNSIELDIAKFWSRQAEKLKEAHRKALELYPENLKLYNHLVEQLPIPDWTDCDKTFLYIWSIGKMFEDCIAETTNSMWKMVPRE